MKRVNGDLTWQAVVYTPRPQSLHRPGQRSVSLCIRGPSRHAKEDSESDGKKLMKAWERGGITEVRKVRCVLNDEAGRGGWKT